VKAHWEKIYSEKSDSDVSWYQEVPETSLKLIDELDLKIKAPIIDVGGGNSKLAGHLCQKGYEEVGVLDISGACIKKMQEKLGDLSNQIHWIESDIISFKPERSYNLWHDRAVFHFLTNPDDRLSYKNNLFNALAENGYFILSTFSIDGPTKCSGLDICQYDLPSLKSLFGDSFELLNVFNEDHITPSGKTQNFIYTVWQKVK